MAYAYSDVVNPEPALHNAGADIGAGGAGPRSGPTGLRNEHSSLTERCWPETHVYKPIVPIIFIQWLMLHSENEYRWKSLTFCSSLYRMPFPDYK